jgi:predicted PurR-regulated permease PerM
MLMLPGRRQNDASSRASQQRRMQNNDQTVLDARAAPVAPAASPTPTGTLLGVLVTAVAALYFGQEILMPVALAILLSFALAPVVMRLRRWRLGRVPSVIGVVALMFVLIIGFGMVVGTQLVDLANNLPSYEQNIRAKIRSLRGAAAGGGIVDQASEMLRDLSKELDEATQQRTAGVVESRTQPEGGIDVVRPIPVEIHEPQPTPWSEIQNLLGPLVAPIGTAGIVLVFVIFMLLQREDLRDRLIRLVGSNDLHRTTEAMTEAANRVSRYLLMQLLINVLYGIPVGIGLFFIGVPNPILWGLLATVLRFIPYVGPFVAATIPIVLSLAVSPGWTEPLLTLGLFVGLELFSNNVLEPWLYGASTGLSPVAIIVAAVFWTTLWGPVGLLLSTPLTVCLVVLGRHVPRLEFLDVMLGNQQVLPDHAKIYQRLLARDPQEAIELAEERMAGGPVADLYDGLMIPALTLAELDRQRGALDTQTQRAISDGIATLVEDLMDHDDPTPATPAPTTSPQATSNRVSENTPVPKASGRVLCIAARNNLDEAAAIMLADLLWRRGLAAEVLSCDAVSTRNLPRLDRDGATFVCLSSMNPKAVQQVRRLARRIRQHFRDDEPILVGFWNLEDDEVRPTDLASATGTDYVATTLLNAVEQVQSLTRPTDRAAAQ